MGGEGVSGGCGPVDGCAGVLVDLPACVGFQVVVGAAEGDEVVGVGGAVGPGIHVVDVDTGVKG